MRPSESNKKLFSSQQNTKQGEHDIFFKDDIASDESDYQLEKNDNHDSSQSPYSLSKEDEMNSRSIIVRNLDFDTTLNEVELMFRNFGLINKVTLLCDKFTGKSKGTAYVEFESQTSRNSSMGLNNQIYKNKMLRLNEKTKEIPKNIGRREKCFNMHMEKYFSSTKNNFGPIKIRKCLKKRTDPY